MLETRDVNLPSLLVHQEPMNVRDHNVAVTAEVHVHAFSQPW